MGILDVAERARDRAKKLGLPVLHVPLDDWLLGHREEEIPRPGRNPLVALKWTIDEWSHQTELVLARRAPSIDLRRRVRNETTDALDMFTDRGWITDPRSYHVDPPHLACPVIERSARAWLDFEHLRFDSRYEPHVDEPGRERWLDYEANRTAHAWVLRHPGPPRPWLVCINGWRTGDPIIDLAAFRARHLFDDLGLNLVFPVLPLQGPRRAGWRSGDRLFTSGPMNTVHALTQGAWDVRRLISWVRHEQHAPAIGLTGISLGGLMTTIVASLEPGLSCAIAGVPETDVARTIRRQLEFWLPPYYEQYGLSWAPAERVLRVVSPLALQPLVPWDRRFIYAGVVDRWIRPGNIHALWLHWDRSSILWYDGSHLSFPFEPSVRRYVDEAIETTVLADAKAAGRESRESEVGAV